MKMSPATVWNVAEWTNRNTTSRNRNSNLTLTLINPRPSCTYNHKIRGTSFIDVSHLHIVKWPVVPERIWKWGVAHVRRETPEKKFSRASPLFDTTSTISRFGQRFCGGQYSLVNFLFAVLLLTVPPLCPAICKSWGTCPLRAPWSRRHWKWLPTTRVRIRHYSHTPEISRRKLYSLRI